MDTHSTSAQRRKLLKRACLVWFGSLKQNRPLLFEDGDWHFRAEGPSDTTLPPSREPKQRHKLDCKHSDISTCPLQWMVPWTDIQAALLLPWYLSSSGCSNVASLFTAEKSWMRIIWYFCNTFQLHSQHYRAQNDSIHGCFVQLLHVNLTIHGQKLGEKLL